MDPNGAFLMKWKVDYLSRKIRFQLIISETAPEVNWFALGFSDRGSLENSDVCLVWIDYKGRDHFEVITIFHSFSKNVTDMEKLLNVRSSIGYARGRRWEIDTR